MRRIVASVLLAQAFIAYLVHHRADIYDLVQGVHQKVTETAHRLRSVSDAPPLVLVSLGEARFQYYLPYIVEQARLWNPYSPIYLAVTSEYYENLPKFHSELEGYDVQFVDYHSVVDQDLRDRFVQSYEAAVRGRGKMLPTVLDKQNDNYQLYTIERLVGVYAVMQSQGLKKAIHMENDIMIYGPLSALAKAADACSVDMATARVNDRTMAFSVLYVRHPDALLELLEWIIAACDKGFGSVSALIGSDWVTDMSLASAYWNSFEGVDQGKAETSRIRSLPGVPDDSCLYKESGYFYDAANLGQWCCGTFFEPTSYFTHRPGSAKYKYWDKPFTWANETEHGWRVPLWDGAKAFDLHMHAKRPWLWRSILHGDEETINPKEAVGLA